MNCQLFVDAENISHKIFFEAYKKISSKHIIMHCSVFGNSAIIKRQYNQYSGLKNFKTYNSRIGKNSADLFITTYLAKAIYCDIDTNLFVIMSSDNDFSPIIALATNENKNIIIVHDANRKISQLKRCGANMSRIQYMPISPKNNFVNKYLPLEFSNKFKNKFNKTVFIKNYGEIVEIPFFEGIDAGVFNKILTYNNLRFCEKLEIDLLNNFLKIKNGNVYFFKEEEYI